MHRTREPPKHVTRCISLSVLVFVLLAVSASPPDGPQWTDVAIARALDVSSLRLVAQSNDYQRWGWGGEGLKPVSSRSRGR